MSLSTLRVLQFYEINAQTHTHTHTHTNAHKKTDKLKIKTMSIQLLPQYGCFARGGS